MQSPHTSDRLGLGIGTRSSSISFRDSRVSAGLATLCRSMRQSFDRLSAGVGPLTVAFDRATKKMEGCTNCPRVEVETGRRS